jgi:dihydroxy-acid dehydratase
MVWEDLKPSDVLSRESFENAITAFMALGGSTNAMVHIVAMARRAGVELVLEDFDRISRRTPLIANLRPAGKYLMEHFHDAGGLRAVLERIRPLLHVDVLTVSGKTLGENIAGAEVFDEDVILTPEAPLAAEGGTFILRGNLCPRGAVIKPAAADPRLLKHTGPALVFDAYPDLKAAIDRDDLEVTADTVLVLRNAGPVGGPGMPEWGMLPIPKKLLKAGVRDMVRLSDARMSGTSYGTCVLHIAPESAEGGPLGLVRTGDLIELDVPGRTLNLLVGEEELAERRAAWRAPVERYARGYGRLFLDEITQADEGCDFRFLAGREPTPEPDIF